MEEYDTKPFQSIFGSIYDNNGCDECKMHYTRFGESPPWYIPGRMCTLELWGRKVDTVEEVPPTVASFAAMRIPGFMSVHSPIPGGPSSYREMMGSDFNDSDGNGGANGVDGSAGSGKRKTLSARKALSVIRRYSNSRRLLMNPKIVEKQLQLDLKAVKAVDWFRGKDSLPLVIEDDDTMTKDRGFIPLVQSCAKKALDKSLSIGQRVKSATSISTLDDSTTI